MRPFVAAELGGERDRRRALGRGGRPARSRRRGRRSPRRARRGGRRRARRPRRRPGRAPASTRAGSRSMPSTRQPFARSSCTASWPIRPRPITAPISPSVGLATRSPWSAIAPSVAKAACSSATPSGHARARGSRAPTRTRRGSRSPRRRRPRGRPARSRATPGADGLDDARAGVAERLRRIEAVRHGAIGRERAFLAQLAQSPGARDPAGCAPCRAATCARSRAPSSRCPATPRRRRCARAPGPGTGAGAGTSSSSSAPVRGLWTICFTRRPARRGRASPGCGAKGRSRRELVERAARRARSRSGRPRQTSTSAGARTAVMRRPRVAHRLPQLRQALLVEAHQAHRGQIERDRIGRREHDAERHVARRERALALAGDDAVDHA